LIAAAKTEAQRLRRLAVQEFGSTLLDDLGDMWRGGNALWERTRLYSEQSLTRSAQRLQARWQAHQQHRARNQNAS
jgi:hypothetical protein